MATKLIVTCIENVDWNGIWTKNEVEQEMRELGIQPTKNDWIEWILDHCIGLLNQSQLDFIKDDDVMSITLHVDGLRVTIAKNH